VQRDLALVVPQSTSYEALEKTVGKIRLDKLQTLQLFDVFEVISWERTGSHWP